MALLIFIFLFSCSHQPDYFEVVDNIVSKETKKIFKEEKVLVFGYGGAMMNGIKTLHITFASFKKVEVHEARRMIIRYIERIRNAVNASEALKDHLIPYPFPTNGMEIGIMFLQNNGKFIEYGPVVLGAGGVSYVSKIKNKLFYSSNNPQIDVLESYFEESYEEALKIVEDEDTYL